MKKEELLFHKDIEAFLTFRESLGFKRISYESYLRSFSRQCSSDYSDDSVLSRGMVMDYMDNQTSELSRKASCLRLFATYLTAIGKEAYIIPKDMYRVQAPQAPHVFSDEEMTVLFQSIDSLDPAKGWIATMAPTLFRLIYTCGLRPGEGRDLKRSNINFTTGEILIEHSKRKKDRLVVMSDDMLKQCNLFDRKRQICGIPGDFFFAGPDGKPYKESFVNSTFVSCWKNAYKKLNEKGTPPRVKVYCLRHRFATAVIHRWLDKKQDLRNKLPYLQVYMGHDRLTDTTYYLHLLPENLVKSAGIDWKVFDGIIPEVDT